MTTSKFPWPIEGEGCSANIVNTIVTTAPSQKKFRFIGRLTVANADNDAKKLCCSVGSLLAVAGPQRMSLRPRRFFSALRQRTLQYRKPAPLAAEVTLLGRPVEASDSNRTVKSEDLVFTREQQARQS